MKIPFLQQKNKEGITPEVIDNEVEETKRYVSDGVKVINVRLEHIQDGLRQLTKQAERNTCIGNM